MTSLIWVDGSTREFLFGPENLEYKKKYQFWVRLNASIHSI